MFIQQPFLLALLDGRKKKEGRMGKTGDALSKKKVGDELFFQTWSLMVWWKITRVTKSECQSHMLEVGGFKSFVPDASTLFEALTVYYLLDPANKESTVSRQSVWVWDSKIKSDKRTNYYSFEGFARKIKRPV